MDDYLTAERLAGGVLVTARVGLFDALPETDESGPLATQVLSTFRSAVRGAPAVVVDLRRAGEINKRTLNVAFQMAKDWSAQGSRRALCGSADLKQVWDLCRGERVCPCCMDLDEARASAGLV